MVLQPLDIKTDVSFLAFGPLLLTAFCIHLHREVPHLSQMNVSVSPLISLPSSKPSCIPFPILVSHPIFYPTESDQNPATLPFTYPSNSILRPSHSTLSAVSCLHNQSPPFPDLLCSLMPLHLSCKCCLSCPMGSFDF